jgi:hypothetical protein
MPQTPRRETLSSLLATHAAIRVARDVGHTPLDVELFYCGNCEADLDWKALAQPNLVVVCPECGTANDLPAYLRPQIQQLSVASRLGDENRHATAQGALAVVIAVVFFVCAMAVLISVMILQPR